jgi:hypothetical protein
LHGHTFWLTGHEGARIPKSAWIPRNTELIGIAQATDFNKPLVSVSDQMVNSMDNCSDLSADVNNINTNVTDSIQNSLPKKHSNNVMPCCVGGNGQISASVFNQQFDFSNIFVVVLNSSENIFPYMNKEELLNLPILSPPEQLALATVNIRI